MPSFSEQIKSLLLKGQREKLFTHFSFSCGSLECIEKSFCFESLPDKRNIFDLASLTKAFATTALVLKEFSSASSFEKTSLVSWLGSPGSQVFTKEIQGLKLASLLKHSSGLPRWWNFWVSCQGEGFGKPLKERLLKRLNEASKKLKPDQGFLYSDVGFLLLGLCLEIKHKKPLNFIFYDYLQSSLSLSGEELYFSSKPLSSSEGFVPTAFCPLRARVLCGEPHDENCAFLGGETGHAGLFGTREGVLSFLEAFWKTKEALLLKKQVGLLSPQSPSFGFASRSFDKRKALGHLGFTGCGFWIFPENSSYLLLLTNRVSSGRLSSSFGSLREELFLLGRKLLDSRKIP